MKQKVNSHNVTDDNGNPTGGSCSGVGISINWQNGPLGRGTERREANGAFVEGVIQAAIERLEFFQSGKFACETNALALEHLAHAMDALESRTADRETRGVEGLHEK
jgi:hypothetical protein